MSGFISILKRCKIYLVTMASFSGISCAPKRLGSIEGYMERRNEIIYHAPVCDVPKSCTIFFGGDIQDYKENMLAHRDNKHHSKWDLESTAVLLHNHFPTHAVIIVRPSKMTLNTFSCYENFAEVNNFGAPTYALNIDALKHLEMLLKNIELAVQQSSRPECDANSLTMKQKFFDGPIDLIGFSKGCIVLNQILYSFSAVINESDQTLMPFIKKIKNIYWLEGGHSGPSSTWVTDKSVLKNFCNLKINVHIHVTPYQVLCDSKPRVAKEEKNFREALQRMGANVRRKLHFENEPRSLDVHFRVLEVFTESVD